MKDFVLVTGIEAVKDTNGAVKKWRVFGETRETLSEGEGYRTVPLSPPPTSTTKVPLGEHFLVIAENEFSSKDGKTIRYQVVESCDDPRELARIKEQMERFAKIPK